MSDFSLFLMNFHIYFTFSLIFCWLITLYRQVLHFSTESTTQSGRTWGFWGFTIFGKGWRSHRSQSPYKPFTSRISNYFRSFSLITGELIK